MRKQRLMGLLVSAMMIMGCAVVPGLGKLVSDTGDPVATGVAGTLTALPSDTQVPSSTVVTAEEAPTSQPAQTAAPDFPPTKEPSRPIPQPTIEVPPPRDISFQRIQETSLGLPLMGRVVTLEHGRWEGAGEAGEILTAYFTEFYAEGDLNGDGARDGAALLAESFGGTGTFVSLMTFINDKGVVRQSGWCFIDDRPETFGLWIENQELVFDGMVHQVEDTMIEPTLHVQQRYRLIDNDLVLVNQASGFDKRTLNYLRLDEPLWGAEVGDTVRLIGSLDTAPFENTLVVSLFDLDGLEFATVPVTVESIDPFQFQGAAIDLEVDLSAVPQGKFRLALYEESARDASLLKLTMVELVRK